MYEQDSSLTLQKVKGIFGEEITASELMVMKKHYSSLCLLAYAINSKEYYKELNDLFKKYGLSTVVDNEIEVTEYEYSPAKRLTEILSDDAR